MAFTVFAYSGNRAMAQSAAVRVLWEPSLMADMVYDFREGVAAVRIFDSDDGSFRLGYVNRYGLTVIPFWSYPPVTHWVTPEFSDGLVSVYSPQNEVVAFFGMDGTEVIPFSFDRIPGSALTFADGLAAVSVDGAWGFIDTAGNVQIPFEYERAGNFSEGLAPVMQNGSWGFIDTTGAVIIPFVLEHFTDEAVGNLFISPGFSEGFAAILLPAADGSGFRWGFLNRAGNRLASYMYHFVEDFTEGRALVMRVDDAGIPVFGFIDSMGEEIAPLIYSFALCFSEGLAAVRYGDIETGLWGFIDHYGSVQVPIRYAEARSFSEGLAAVRTGARWGFIDRLGNEAVPAVYEQVRDFSHGLAAVSVGEGDDARWGFIDRAGNIVVPIEYLEAQSFSEGLAWVRCINGWGVLEVDPTAGQITEQEGLVSRYIHTDIADYFLFNPQPGVLGSIYDPTGANEAIRGVVSTLTSAQRHSGTALNTVTLFIENAIRRGTTQDVPADGNMRADILQASTVTARNIGHETINVLTNEEINLMRLLNTTVNFVSDEREALHFTFPDDVSVLDFDNIMVETGFAGLTINRNRIPQGSEISIRRGAPVRAFTPAADMPAPAVNTDVSDRSLGDRVRGVIGDDFGPRDLLNFWSVGVVTLLMLVWGILASAGHKLRYWVVPTFSVLVIALNIWTLRQMQEAPGAASSGGAGYFDSVTVNIPAGMKAILSIPINGANPEHLVIYNENGEPQLSRHNPVTDTIDARIQAGGTYFVREHELSFADIETGSPQSQRAILRLASMGIMQGRDMGEYFRPDSAITRGELAGAVVIALGLTDTHTHNPFTDSNPEDWYYHAIATANNLNLMHGFDDGTFRSSWAVTKDELVLTVAGVLMEHMGYHIPANIDEILARYHDREQLELWSVPAIALVTAADILIYREDGLFAPGSVMAREDAAVVLYRLLGRLW